MGDAAGVIDVGLVHRRVRQRRDEPPLAGGHDGRVAGGDDDGVGHVHLADPVGCVEAGEREPGLHGPAPVGEGQLAIHPAPQAAVDAGASAGGRRRPEALHQRRAQVPDGLEAAEPVGGGAQDEPGDPLAVAVPDELGDRAAHRVADDDGLVDPEHVEGGDGVVGAVGQPDRRVGADPAAVTAVVDGHHPVALGQRRVGREPVGVGGHPEAVEQEHRRRTGRRSLQPDEGRAPTGQLERPAREQPRRVPGGVLARGAEAGRQASGPDAVTGW